MNQIARNSRRFPSLRLCSALLAAVTGVLVVDSDALAANTANNYVGATAGNLTTDANWLLATTPESHVAPIITHDAVFTTSSTTGIKGFGTGTTSSGSLTLGSLNVTAISGSYGIRNNSQSSIDSTLTLGGSGNLGNSVSGTASDLVYVVAGGTLNLLGENGGSPTSGTGILKVVLGQSGSFNIAGTASATAVISDGGNGYALTKTGAGTLTLSAANTYTGLTTVTAGTLAYGANNVLSDSSGLVINGATAVVSLGTDRTDTVASITLDGGQLTGSGTSTLTSTGTIELRSGSVNAILAGTGTGLSKTTAGTVTLSNANTYTGPTSITGGTLSYGTSNVLSDSSDVTVNGPTAVLSLGSNRSDTVHAVTLDGGGQITGSGSSTLTSLTPFDLRNGSASTILAGAVSLNKTGPGTVTLSGTNTYSGATTISDGVLAISAVSGLGNASSTNGVQLDGGTLQSLNNTYALGSNRTVSVAANKTGTVQVDAGTLTIDGTVTASGTLVVTGNGNTTISSTTFSGNGGLTKNGAGTVLLSGSAANQYAGTTTVNAGALRLGKTSAIAIPGNLTIAGGAVDYATTTDEQIANSSNVQIASGSLALGTRTETIGDLTNGVGSYSQSGTAAVSIGSSGKLILNRQPVISGGTLALSAASGSIVVNDALAFNGGTISFDASPASALTRLNLAGDVSYAGTTQALITSASANNRIDIGNSNDTRTFTIASSSTLAATTPRVAEVRIDATILSGAAISKAGTGILELRGANIYSGGTTVSNGTLRVNNGTTGSGTGTGRVTVNSGATLAGDGTIGNSTDVAQRVLISAGGKIAPGANPSTTGKLATNYQTWTGGPAATTANGTYAGGIYEWKYAGTGGAGVAGGWDLLTMSTLNLSGVTSSAKFTILARNIGTALAAGSYTILTAGTIVGRPADLANAFVLDASALGLPSSMPTALKFTSDGSASGGSFSIEVSPAPEPTTAALFGLGGMSLLGFRRRRLSALQN